MGVGMSENLYIQVVEYDDYKSKTHFVGAGNLLKIKVGKQNYQIRATYRDGLRVILVGHDNESSLGRSAIILPSNQEVTVISEASMEADVEQRLNYVRKQAKKQAKEVI